MTLLSDNAVQSISMHSFLRFSEVAQRCGFEVEGLLTHAGLKPDVQYRNSERLPLQRLTRIFEHGMANSKLHWFPLALAESFSFDFFPEVETFLATSSNLKEASKLLHWLPHLILPELVFDITQSDQRLELKVRVDHAAASEQETALIKGIEESIVCCVAMFMKKLKLPIEDVVLHFEHSTHPLLAQFGQKMGIHIKSET
jgi:hypothetical protein